MSAQTHASTPFPHELTRTVHIGAPPALVFGYFTDDERWARWWGPGSRIDPRPGGRVLIRDGASAVQGEVLEIDPPRRLVFTYGFVSGHLIPPGGSRVTIVLDEAGGGTRLTLVHAFGDVEARDAHVQGWRYQLSVFANVIADELHRDAARLVDGWFDAWSDPDAASRTARLDALVTSEVTLRDRYSLIEGRDDLLPHLAAVHTFMPGLRLVRDGATRHCQGLVLADWVARTASGEERARGTNAFTIAPEGRIASVVGFWSAPGPA